MEGSTVLWGWVVAKDVGTDGEGPEAALSAEDVWRAIGRASFCVLSYTTPGGGPRSSGVVYSIKDARLFMVVDPSSWKARHLSAQRRVAVTIPVRRGGLLSLAAPIPPATISFCATAVVHSPDEALARSVRDEMASLLPVARREAGAVVEVIPTGAFVTYGIGVPLAKLRDPTAAQGRVPIQTDRS